MHNSVLVPCAPLTFTCHFKGKSSNNVTNSLYAFIIYVEPCGCLLSLGLNCTEIVNINNDIYIYSRES